MQTTSKLRTWRGFSAGQRVVMLIETRGATREDEEITYPIGTYATIETIVDFGNYQGNGVHLVIGDGDHIIVNSFDDRDVMELGKVPFHCT